MNNPIEYEIAIKFLDEKIKKNDLVALRDFTELPLGELNRLATEKSIVLGSLVNEQFYSGVKELLILLNSLESSYQLFSNSSEIDKSFLEDIANKISNIKLSDIR